MDIQQYLIDQWALPNKIPLPFLVTGPGSAGLVAAVARSRPGSLYLDTAISLANITTLDAWKIRRSPDWIGAAFALDRLTDERLVAATLSRWLISSGDQLGLVFSWEGTGLPLAAWDALVSSCYQFRLPGDPKPNLPRGTWTEIACATVCSVLAALARKDREVLERALTTFGPREMEMLRRWHFEAMTGQWEVFSVEDSAGFHQNKPFLIHLLKQFDARSDSRILAKSVFLPMVVS